MRWLADMAAGFRRGEPGATAVEFAILMPVMMVVFGAVVEGSRIYWNYQGAVSGVRDAVRYLARTTPPGICAGPSDNQENLPGGSDVAEEIIARNLGSDQGNLFPLGVNLSHVTVTYSCPDLELRSGPMPLVRVEAKLVVTLPFGTVFELFGRRDTRVLRAIVVDHSRIYGV